jgi:hypothetical protein
MPRGGDGLGVDTIMNPPTPFFVSAWSFTSKRDWALIRHAHKHLMFPSGMLSSYSQLCVATQSSSAHGRACQRQYPARELCISDMVRLNVLFHLQDEDDHSADDKPDGLYYPAHGYHAIDPTPRASGTIRTRKPYHGGGQLKGEDAQRKARENGGGDNPGLQGEWLGLQITLELGQRKQSAT